MEFNSVYDLVSYALRPYGITPSVSACGQWMRIPAVWRGSRDPNLAVSMTTGTTFDFVDGAQKFSFAELKSMLRMGESVLVGTKSKIRRKEIDLSSENRINMANQYWEKGIPLSKPGRTTDTVKLYFRKRGLPDSVIKLVEGSLRVSPCPQNGAMVLFPIVSPLTAKRIGLQRLLLNQDGSKRDLDGESRFMIGKFLHGDSAGGFLLSPGGANFNRSVVICEGFETGMALLAGLGCSVYVMYNTAGVARVNFEYLTNMGFSNVIIAGDSDPMDKFHVHPGHKAANLLAARFYNELNRRFSIAMAPLSYSIDGKGLKADWLDVWKLNPAKFSEIFKAAMKEYDPFTDPYREGMKTLPPVQIRKRF